MAASRKRAEIAYSGHIDTAAEIVLVLLVLIPAVIVGVRKAVHDSEKNAHITPAMFAHVKVGASSRRVHRLLGKPNDIQTYTDGPREVCWYGGILASRGSYEFCFRGRRLVTKDHLPGSK